MRIRTLMALLALLVVPVFCSAQYGTGLYSHGSFDNRGFDTINLGNLNVHFSVPIFSKQGRGGNNFQYNLTYDGIVYSTAVVGSTTAWTPSNGFGWGSDNTVPILGSLMYSTSTATCDLGTTGPPNEDPGSSGPGSEQYDYAPEYGQFVYFDTSGSAHQISGYVGGCTEGMGDAYSGTAGPNGGYSVIFNPNSGSTQVSSFAIVLPSGKQVVVPANSSSNNNAALTDSNGNQILWNNGSFTDTTGTTVLSASGGNYSFPYLTGTFPNFTSSLETTSVTYKAYTVRTVFGSSGVAEYGPASVSLVDRITLPDGTYYQFNYEATPGSSSGEVTGRLLSVTLPTNGTIQYSYGTGINADGSPTSLQRQDGQGTWQYNRSNSGGVLQTAWITPDQKETDISFLTANGNPYEVSRTVHDGLASAGGTPLAAYTTLYNHASGDPAQQTLNLPLIEIDASVGYDGGPTARTDTHLDGFDNATAVDVYDFSGNKLSSDQYVYTSVNTSQGTVDQLQSHTTNDGAGNAASLTTYSYDGATPTATQGLPNHVSVSGARNNLTQVSQSIDGTNSLTTTYAYDDTGTVLSSTTPNGTTTYSHDGTGTFVTGQTLPTPSSGVTIASSATYDTSTGLMTSATDANNQRTSINSFDVFGRPNEIDYPDGGKTTFSYAATQVSEHIYQNSSQYSDVEAFTDAFGMPIRTATASGGSNYTIQDTCYDSNYRVSFSSLPYSKTLGPQVCTSTGDAYTYDNLNRLVQTTHADSSSRIAVYQGRAVQKTDENGVSRISQMDALGRLTNVCEISKNTDAAGNSPVACPTDIQKQTGFNTTYSYDLAAHQTTVSQGQQTRTFQTDWAGRTTLVQEPESGTTTYGYAYNSTGLVVTRQRPRANQTNPSTLTTTTTQYDSLSRPVSTTYDDGTMTRNYNYDRSAGWGLQQSNLVGRLTRQDTTAGGQAGGASIFSYDAMGRVAAMSECPPSRCGQSEVQVFYHYDLEGNLLDAGDGTGVTTYYNSYTPENRVGSITNSLNDATHPSTLMQSPSYGPFGPTGYQLGNGLYNARQYDSLGNLAQSWVCTGSTDIQCPGGAGLYASAVKRTGRQLTTECDTAFSNANNCYDYRYDEFGRLQTRTKQDSNTLLTTYTYDRYGNRWGGQTGPTLSFNAANNREVNTSQYDAAGNLISDSQNNYQYDAEGNLVSVNNGSTAQYIYDGLNQRVRTVAGGVTREYVFNASGQRVSIWDPSTQTAVQGQYYWGSTPLGYHLADGTRFQHQNWLGTERARTLYNGTVEGTYSSLPFGDTPPPGDPQQGSSTTNTDAYHFAGLDHDFGTSDHAQFRQYSDQQGRWHSPDPYLGSYRWGNPQSLNRYAYAGNSPLINTDSVGLDYCISSSTTIYYHWDDHHGDGDPTEVIDQVVDNGDGFCWGGGYGGGLFGGLIGAGGGGSPSDPPASSPPPCLAQRIVNAIPGAQLTGGQTAQGGHEEFNIITTPAQLLSAGFTPFKVLGIWPNGYHNDALHLQVHVNGQGNELTGDASGILNVQGHIDVFNPDSGLLGFILHGIWDLAIGTWFYKHSSALDPGC